MQALADRGERSEALQLQLTSLQFIPVVERAIEQPHALINARVAKRKVNAPYVSLSTRHPCLLQQIRCCEATQQDLAHQYGIARVPAKLVQLLHLEHHPKWLAAKSKTSSQLAVLDQIIYRCDMESSFWSQKEARKLNMKAARSEALQAAAVLRQQRGRRDVQHATLDELMSGLVLDHLRAMLEPGSGIVGLMLNNLASFLCMLWTPTPSVPVLLRVPKASSGQGLYLCERVGVGWGLGARTAVTHHFQLRSGDVLSVEMSAHNHLFNVNAAMGFNAWNGFQALSVDADCGGHVFAASENIYFRVVHKMPARFHTVCTPSASGGRLCPSDIAVTVHINCSSSAEAPVICMDAARLEGNGVALLRDLGAIPYQKLKLLTRWSMQRKFMTLHGVAYTTEEHAGNVHLLLEKLLRAGAFQDSGIHLTCLVQSTLPLCLLSFLCKKPAVYLLLVVRWRAGKLVHTCLCLSRGGRDSHLWCSWTAQLSSCNHVWA